MSAFFFRSNPLRKYASLNHSSFVCGYKLIHHDTNNKLYEYEANSNRGDDNPLNRGSVLIGSEGRG